MKRYKIGLFYRRWVKDGPFMYCNVYGHNDQDALAKAHSVLKPNHMQILNILETGVDRVMDWQYNIGLTVKQGATA